MARIRTVKPEFFTDEGLNDVSLEAHFLALALPTMADCAGRLEDRPRTIKLAAFPFRDVDVEARLQELETLGFVLRYEVAGRRYIQIRNFKKHQRLSGKEASASSEIPAPPRFPCEGSDGEVIGKQLGSQERKGKERDHAPTPSPQVREDDEEDEIPFEDGPFPQTPPPDASPEDKLSSDPSGQLSPPSPPRAGRRRLGLDNPVIAALRAEWPTKADFPRYERNDGWAKAIKAAEAHRLTTADLPLLIEALRRDKASEKWRADGGQFIPGPEPWINKRRDIDLRLEGGPPAEMPVAPELSSRPWWLTFCSVSKTPAAPSVTDVMNLAHALGLHDRDIEAANLWRQKGLLATGDWAWANRSTQ